MNSFRFALKNPIGCQVCLFGLLRSSGPRTKQPASLLTREQVFSIVELLKQFTCVFTWRAAGGSDKPNEEWVLGTTTTTKELGCGTGYAQQRD
jgi:hypothetical protein